MRISVLVPVLPHVTLITECRQASLLLWVPGSPLLLFAHTPQAVDEALSHASPLPRVGAASLPPRTVAAAAKLTESERLAVFGRVGAGASALEAEYGGGP